ncbi:uncharacterized protein LOC112038332 [Quercus suber]|uniref:uncharacterized protein LOC112038332 n=1 Tax=Quercus suber TaxID=58331 RepID=UPI000CE25294|nr:uncharacterized protein LOC112038332 [Quercus suber]
MALAEDEDKEESLSGMPWEDEEIVTHERFEPEEEKDDPSTHEKEPGMEESKFQESQQRKPERERESSVLPDCLLLMMCEPKFSMEVSKETWVCSTDFIRWLQERPIKKTNGRDGKDPKKKKQKLMEAKGCESFVLTRCKSEPMRSSAKLMREPCFWKNMNKSGFA